MPALRYLVCAIALTCGASLTVSAQESAQRGIAGSPYNCDEAIALVRDSLRTPAARLALERLTRCGEPGYLSVAVAIRAERASQDFALVNELHKFLRWSPRGVLLDAILDVARDSAASVLARGMALYALARETHRDVMVDYRGMVAGLDPRGVPLGSCHSGHVTDHGPSGLSAADVTRIRQVASTIYRDKSQPGEVRSAAMCLAS